MPPPYWQIRKGSYTGTLLQNVTNVVVNKGRRVLSDNYSAGNATITGLRPDLLPSLAIGDEIYCILNNPNQSPQEKIETFKIADFRIEYGFQQSMDQWELVLEDAFATLGRAQYNQVFASGDTTKYLFEQIADFAGLTRTTSGGTTPKTVSGHTLTNQSMLAVLQNTINTEQGLLYATGTALTMWLNGWQASTTFFNFSDAGGAATKYSRLNFFSMADNLANRVTVTINGGTGATVGSGLYSYELDSFALNSTAADNIARYVSGALSVQSTAPNQMTIILNNETSDRTYGALSQNAAVNITFRGTTYQATVIGYTIASDVNITRVTLNLASTAFYNFLILNSTVYGTLDNNRLGF